MLLLTQQNCLLAPVGNNDAARRKRRPDEIRRRARPLYDDGEMFTLLHVAGAVSEDEWAALVLS